MIISVSTFYKIANKMATNGLIGDIDGLLRANLAPNVDHPGPIMDVRSAVEKELDESAEKILLGGNSISTQYISSSANK